MGRRNKGLGYSMLLFYVGGCKATAFPICEAHMLDVFMFKVQVPHSVASKPIPIGPLVGLLKG